MDIMDKDNIINEAADLISAVAMNLRITEIDGLYHVELDDLIDLKIHKSVGVEMPETIVNLAVIKLINASFEIKMDAMRERYPHIMKGADDE